MNHKDLRTFGRTILGFATIVLSVATPWLGRMHCEQILRGRFQFFLYPEAGGYLAQEQARDFKDLSGAIPYLSNLRSVNTLVLRDCDKLADVSALQDLKALETLDLGNTRITNIDALKNLKALRTLDLRNTKITNVDGLRGLKTLRELHLDGCNQLSREAVRQLRTTLPQTSISF